MNPCNIITEIRRVEGDHLVVAALQRARLQVHLHFPTIPPRLQRTHQQLECSAMGPVPPVQPPHAPHVLLLALSTLFMHVPMQDVGQVMDVHEGKAYGVISLGQLVLPLHLNAVLHRGAEHKPTRKHRPSGRRGIKPKRERHRPASVGTQFLGHQADRMTRLL